MQRHCPCCDASLSDKLKLKARFVECSKCYHQIFLATQESSKIQKLPTDLADLAIVSLNFCQDGKKIISFKPEYHILDAKKVEEFGYLNQLDSEIEELRQAIEEEMRLIEEEKQEKKSLNPNILDNDKGNNDKDNNDKDKNKYGSHGEMTQNNGSDVHCGPNHQKVIEPFMTNELNNPQKALSEENSTVLTDEQKFAKALGLPVIENKIDLDSEPIIVNNAQSTKGAHLKDIAQKFEKEPIHKSTVSLKVIIPLAIILVGAAFFAANHFYFQFFPEHQLSEQEILELNKMVTSKLNEPDAGGASNGKKYSAAYLDAVRFYQEGNRLYVQKKYKDALESYKSALQSDTEFVYAHRAMGVTYAVLGQNRKAVKSYKLYLELAPNAKDYKQVERLIKNFDDAH